MNEAIETLKKLLQQKHAVFSKMESEVQSLEMQMREINGQIEGIVASIQALSPVISASSQQPPLIGKYSKMNLTPAIQDILATSGAAPGLLVPEIIERLKSEGFNGKMKNLYASAYTVALRLIKDGKAREGKKGGKRSFMKN